MSVALGVYGCKNEETMENFLLLTWVFDAELIGKWKAATLGTQDENSKDNERRDRAL